MAPSLFASASPEFWLVAACCRWPSDAKCATAVEQALQHTLQWPRVLSLARRHRVSGLVAHALASESSVPADVRRTLVKAQQSISLANMAALRAQANLAKIFQQNSLPFAILKGTPLAVKAYGSLALRQSRDIDLLINETDVPHVHKLLHAEGYQRTGLSATLDERQQRLWMRFRKHYEYQSTRTGIRLELHWRTTDNRYLAGASDALGRREQVTVAPGIALPLLSREELLLDLCTHGAGHAWFRMKWIADVNALLREPGADGQASLLHAARRHGLERPVLQALYLCRALFDLPLACEAVALPSPVQRLLHIAAGALLQEDVTAPTATSDFVPKHQTLSHMLLRADWRYRLEELRLNMASPSDWQQVSLPAGMQFVYPVLRLPLWLKRRWRIGGSGSRYETR